MLTPEQEQNLKDNIHATTERQTSKYVNGQPEHGGNLWEKPGMLRNAENEIADLNNYIPTLRRQLNEVLDLVKTDQPREAALLLEKILSPDCG